MVTATAPTTAIYPTGMDLRLERTRRLVTQTAVAREMGVSPQAVSNLEALLRPTERAVYRYLEALNRAAPGRANGQ
jgi:transcriptional regulator with XRE-family HTH domain